MGIQFPFLERKDGEFIGGAIYEDTDHKFVWLGFEEEESEGIVQVNQYLITHGGKGILLDAGGISVFPQVLANLSRFINPKNIQTLFFTHQDPDVSSGISLWLDVTPAKAYIGNYWKQFVPHLGIKDTSRVIPIPDEGMKLDLGGKDYLEFIPAHFLHSVSNFHLYDSRSKILFSGDVGAAVFPKGKKYIQVENFQSHLPYMEAFHKRFMTSNRACKKWAQEIKKREIVAIAPQHGAIFSGENVGKFVHWISELSCGVDMY